MVILLIVVGVGVGWFGIQPPQGLMVEALEGAAAAEMGELVASSADADAPWSVSPARTCPPGMLKFEATELRHLPGGDRSGLPKWAEAIPLPVQLSAFCLDQAPRRLPMTGDEKPFEHCLRTDPDASTCLSHDEARAVCRHAAEGGELPTFAQWEAAALAWPPELELPGDEWAEIRSDSALSVGFGGNLLEEPSCVEGAALLTWIFRSPTDRRPTRTFRCAAPLQ